MEVQAKVEWFDTATCKTTKTVKVPFHFYSYSLEKNHPGLAFDLDLVCPSLSKENCVCMNISFKDINKALEGSNFKIVENSGGEMYDEKINIKALRDGRKFKQGQGVGCWVADNENVPSLIVSLYDGNEYEIQVSMRDLLHVFESRGWAVSLYETRIKNRKGVNNK